MFRTASADVLSCSFWYLDCNDLSFEAACLSSTASALCCNLRESEANFPNYFAANPNDSPNVPVLVGALNAEARLKYSSALSGPFLVLANISANF